MAKCNSVTPRRLPALCWFLPAGDLQSWDSAVSWIRLFHYDQANTVVIDGGSYPALQYWFEVAPDGPALSVLWLLCFLLLLLSGLVFFLAKTEAKGADSDTPDHHIVFFNMQDGTKALHKASIT